jgi:hypothetical protein
LWLDPGGQRSGLVTGASTTSSATTPQPVNSIGTWQKALGSKKAVVQAPPGVGGLVMVYASGAIVSASTGAIQLRLTSLLGTVLTGQVRQAGSGLPNEAVPFAITGMLPLGPGGVDELALEYTYTSAAATPSALWNPTLQTVFMPNGVMAGAAAQDASVRWWDGDSWRPDMLRPAAVDVSQDAGTASPTRTTTTTSLARSATTIHEDGTVTLTATVSPSPTGSVTFSSAKSASGPWTSLGAVPLASGKAVKTWKSVRGAWYFKASYTGDTLYAPSESGAQTVTVQYLQHVATTLQATKSQSYGGSGDKVVDTGHNTAVIQGLAPPNGNVKTMLWFNSTVPAGASVTSVVLVCKSGGWAHWENSSGGTLIVGDFYNVASVPTRYPGSQTKEDRSRHAVDKGGWSINLSSWGRAELERSDFDGLVFGRGPSDAAVYTGYSTSPGENQFSLKVEYDRWTTP